MSAAAGSGRITLNETAPHHLWASYVDAASAVDVAHRAPDAVINVDATAADVEDNRVPLPMPRRRPTSPELCTASSLMRSPSVAM
jgi:hypothetical protein